MRNPTEETDVENPERQIRQAWPEDREKDQDGHDAEDHYEEGLKALLGRRARVIGLVSR